MRTWLLILAITSVALAGTTSYLAFQLHELSSRQADPGPATPPAPASIAARSSVKESSVPASPTRPAPANSLAKGEAPAQASSQAMVNGRHLSDAEMKRMQADYARHFLAQLADPQLREEMVAQRKMFVRHQFPRVDRYLGLGAEEYSRFLELHALQQIGMQEANSRCAIDPECQMHAMPRSGQDPHSQELANLLGPERAQKFETFKNTLGEREAVAQLRSRLGDSLRIGDDKAEQLITALAQEREAIYREAANGGQGVHSFGMGVGMVFSPNDGRSFEERVEAARQSSQRIRDRAAQYLNAEQSRVFNEMQDETLLALRGALRQKEPNTIDGVSFSAVAVSSGN